MAEAVGLLEVYGLTTAFQAADAGCKAANVRLEIFDKNKPARNADKMPVPLIICVKFRGSVQDVTAAVEAGMAIAAFCGPFTASHHKSSLLIGGQFSFHPLISQLPEQQRA